MLLLTGGLCGCGYSHQPLFADDAGTVAVPIFENQTFYRDVERDMTEALIKEIELRTPYKVVSSPQADTRLSGVIQRVDQHRLNRRRQGGLPTEMDMSVTVDFLWQDLRSGKTLRHRSGLIATGQYIPAVEVGEQYQTAQHQAVQDMARKIVSAMAEPW